MKALWNARHGAAANARRRLPEMAAAYFAEGRALVAIPDASARELHAFRLSTKRLRYTLELFRPCYGPGLERRLAELRKLQQFLGEINDCAAAGRLTADLFPPQGRARAHWEEFLARRAAERTEAFRTHWRQVFDRPGQERRWLTYLRRVLA